MTIELSTDDRHRAAVVRPPVGVRLTAAGLAVFGVLFGVSGLAAIPDTGALATMTAAGLAFTLGGIAACRARVWVEDQSLYTRWLLTRRIDAPELRSLRRQLRGTPGSVYIRAERSNGRPIWLVASGRLNTAKNLCLIDEQIRVLNEALGGRGNSDRRRAGRKEAATS